MQDQFLTSKSCFLTLQLYILPKQTDPKTAVKGYKHPESSFAFGNKLVTHACMEVSQSKKLLSSLMQVNPVTFAHSPEEYLIAIGLQPTRPNADLKPELDEESSDQLHQHSVAAADSRSEEGRADPSSSSGQFLEQPQGQLQKAPRDQSQKPHTLQHSSEQATSIKRAPDTVSGTDKESHRKQQQQSQQKGKHKPDRPGQHQTASSRPASRGPIGSPAAKIVSLSSLQPQPAAQQAPGPRTITVGMPSFPVGSTTGIVGRTWPGQPPFANAPKAAPGDGKGTKRPGGEGESKGKKRQRRSDREKSVDGDGEATLTALSPCSVFSTTQSFQLTIYYSISYIMQRQIKP